MRGGGGDSNQPPSPLSPSVAKRKSMQIRGEGQNPFAPKIRAWKLKILRFFKWDTSNFRGPCTQHLNFWFTFLCVWLCHAHVWRILYTKLQFGYMVNRCQEQNSIMNYNFCCCFLLNAHTLHCLESSIFIEMLCCFFVYQILILLKL